MLYRPVLDTLLHTLGLNKHFPLALVHAGPGSLGLGIDDFSTVQGVAQLKLLLGHMNMNDRTGELAAITVGSLELEVGMGKCPLWHPHVTKLDHVTTTWVSSIGRFLHRMGCRIETRLVRQVGPQRVNDNFLMQLALDGKYKLKLIQQCRLWLQVCTLADICDAAGKQIEKWAFKKKGRKSKLKWMQQEEPSRKAWGEWRRFLCSLVVDRRSDSGYYLKQNYKMAAWRSTHQEWQWLGDPMMVVNCEGQRFWREGAGLRSMREDLQYVAQKLHPVQVHEARSGMRRFRDPGWLRCNCVDGEDGVRRLRGRTLPTMQGLCINDIEGDLVIATDGTLKNGKGGAACTLHTTVEPGTIKAIIPVDGRPNQLSSYRTELFGMLGALLILHEVLQNYKGPLLLATATLWCDNQSAVNKFNLLSGERHYSIATANMADADVLQEIRYWKHSLPIPIAANWVKSHQDECTTREARLNRIVDRLASMQHNTTGEWASTTKSQMLPHTIAQLHLPQGRYTGCINKNIQYELWSEEANEYILRKLNLNQRGMRIDWSSLGRHHKSLSWQRRATRLKMIFRWAPTQSRLHRIQQADSAKCPLCNSEIETVEHVMQCKSPAATSARKAALVELELSLEDVGTHPDLVSIMSEAIETGREPVCDCSESEINLQGLMDAQRKVGWPYLKFGVLALEWRNTQTAWAELRDPDYSNKREDRWATQVQEILWQYVTTVWEHRNATVHGKDENEARRIKTDKLRAQARAVVTNPPALGPRDRHLLTDYDVGRMKGRILHHWLRAVRSAARKESLLRKKEEREGVIRFMAGLRERQRRRRPRTYRQQTVTEFLAGVLDSSDPNDDGESATNDISGPLGLRIIAQRELQQSVPHHDNS